MAPTIHPPCTPSPSCAPIRCHPTPPPCPDPEKCLRTTISKRVKPCQSAVSIMQSRPKSCASLGQYKGPDNKNIKNERAVEEYLKRKSKENEMKRKDRLKGTNTFRQYQKKQGKPRAATQCCAGKGHRGRLKKGIGKPEKAPGGGGQGGGKGGGKCAIL